MQRNSSFLLNRSRKTRVLFVSPPFSVGGAEIALITLLRYLDRTMFELGLCFVTYGDHPRNPSFLESDLPSDVSKYDISTPKRLRQSLAPLVRKIAGIMTNHDIVISNLFLSPFPITFLGARLAGRPFVAIARETRSLVRSHDGRAVGKRSLSYKLLSTIEDHTLKLCDRIIAVSNGVAEDLIEHYRVPPSKIRVIYDPIDIPRIQELSQINPSFRFLPSTPYLVSVARLVYRKKHDELLRALAMARRHVKVELLLVGDGNLRSSLESLAAQLGLSKNVHFLGFQPNPYQFLARCDASILYSVEEGLGLVLLESMAVGTPVISSNCPSGPREIIQHGECGILVPSNNPQALADAIVRVLLDANLRRTLATKGKRRAEDFDAARSVRTYEELIRECVKSNSHPAK
jgi:glycosyltransferase involved in cell wall biosynthesis